MYGQFQQLPDYRLDIVDVATGHVISTGYFTAKQEEQIGEIVRQTGRPYHLEPMNAYERRIVHNAFKDDPEIATWSPDDSARIKQITLLKRQPKKEPASQGEAIS